MILIKNLCLSKKYGARRLLSELPDKGSLKRIHKTGIVPQTGSSRPCLSRSSEGPCAESGGQA